MKILHVINFFSPLHGGGSIEACYYLSKGLTEKGHQVTIYTSNHEIDNEYLNSIPEVRVYPFRIWLSWANFYITPGIIKEAKKELKHFDVIHMHNYRTFQNVIIYYYARKYNIPYVLQAHGSLPTFSQKRSLKWFFDRIWGYSILKNASKLLALTPMEVEQYKSLGIDKNKIEIVPNGIDFSEFQNLPEKGQFKKEYNLSNDTKIILYLGRIHKTKGIDLLVESFADVLKEINNVKLVIVGPDDGYLQYLKNLVKKIRIEKQVLFINSLYGREKLKAYVDADVHVLPRHFEPFGMTLIEACACGIPAICSKGCGIADVINNRTGFAVSYNKEAFKQAIIAILTKEELRKKFGQQGRELVAKQFNWDKIVSQLEKIYQQIIKT